VTGMMLASCGNGCDNNRSIGDYNFRRTDSGLPLPTEATSKNYSMAEIQDDNLVNGWGGRENTGWYNYRFLINILQLLLTDILYPVGGVTTGESVKLTSANGSSTTLTYDQVVNGNFNIYNSTGSQITTATKPTICIYFLPKMESPLDGSTGQLELGALSL